MARHISVRRRRRRGAGRLILIFAILSCLIFGGAAVRAHFAAPPGQLQLTAVVNKWHLLPENFDVDLVSIDADHLVDSRCYSDLVGMMQDCRAECGEMAIYSSWRSHEHQTELFEAKIERVMRQDGVSYDAARAQAMTVVAPPGESEHETGLALDIVDADYMQLDERQAAMPVQQWLMANSWRYGFILRYPSDKSELTGIIYEPWHYRYVGRAAAREIYRGGMCLEEYAERRGT